MDGTRMRWEHFALSILGAALLTGLTAWVNFGPATASSAELQSLESEVSRHEVVLATMGARISAMEATLQELKQDMREALRLLRTGPRTEYTPRVLPSDETSRG